MEKLLDPVDSDDEGSYPPQAGTQMYSAPVPPAYSPPGATGGPTAPGYTGAPMGAYGGGPAGAMGGHMGGPSGGHMGGPSGHDGGPMVQVVPQPQPQGQSHTNTTVIINQPAPMSMRNTGPRDWSSAMCSCCDDMGSCLLGTFCPCILASQVAGDMDESICVPCCVPGWLIVLRTKLRAENNITGTVMDDCCMVCCCGHCVLCQMARELKFIKMSYRPAPF